MFSVLLQDGSTRECDGTGYIAKVSMKETENGSPDSQTVAEATFRPHSLTLDTKMNALTIAPPVCIALLLRGGSYTHKMQVGEPIQQSLAPPIGEAKVESPRILVVDDNPINQMVCQIRLHVCKSKYDTNTS